MNASQRYQRWQSLFREYIEQHQERFDTRLVYEHCDPSFFHSESQESVCDAALPLGLSRLDGLPDLPDGTAWPEQDGKLIDFVAQINLSDLEKEFHPALPERGWLYFFVGDPYAHSIIPHQVLFFEGSEDQLVRAKLPPRGQPDQTTSQTTLIQFVPGFTVDPDYRSRVLYPPISGRIPPGYPDELPPDHQCQPEITRIGGFGYAFQGREPDERARLFLNGFPLMVQFRYMSEFPEYMRYHEQQAYMRKMQREAAKAGKYQELCREAERYEEIKEDLNVYFVPTEMLLGLESSPRRSWGDMGFLQFFIRRDDLERRDFTRTFCDIIST